MNCAALLGLFGGLLFLDSACTRSGRTESAAASDLAPRSAVQNTAREPDLATTLLDQADVNGLVLELHAKDKSCVLRVGNTEHPLIPTAPCFFLRRRGSVQNFPFRDAKLDFVLIVAGNPVSDTIRQKWNLQSGDVCGDHSQAVLGSGANVRVSQSVHTGGVFCRDQGVDEKEFWSFAHH